MHFFGLEYFLALFQILYPIFSTLPPAGGSCTTGSYQTPSGLAAPTFIHASAVTSLASNSITYLTGSNLGAVVFAYCSTAGVTMSVNGGADSAGNTFSAIGQMNNGAAQGTVFMAYGTITTTGNATATVNVAGGGCPGDLYVDIVEFSQLNGADSVGPAIASGTTSGSISPTQSGVLLVTFIVGGDGISLPTASGGWTIIQTNDSGSHMVGWAYQTQTTCSPYTGTMTYTGGGSTSTGVIAMKAHS